MSTPISICEQSVNYVLNISNRMEYAFFSRLAACQKELAEERVMSQALRSNQSGWESKCSALDEKFKKYQTEKEAEIADLKDQARDLMFYMEAQKVIGNSELKDEIATSSITIVPPEVDTSKKIRRKKK